MTGMALKLLGNKISNVGGRRNGLFTYAMSSKSGEELLPVRILEHICNNTEQMVLGLNDLQGGMKDLQGGMQGGMKDLQGGMKSLVVQAENSNKILRHLSGNIDQFVRSSVRSTEQEVGIAAHAFAKELLGESIGELEFNRFVRDTKTKKKIAELDACFVLGSNVVCIVEAKSHVTEVDVTTLLLKSSKTVNEEKFTSSVLFIGGPTVDKRAKAYAQEEGIYVLEYSGSRYGVKGKKSLEFSFQLRNLLFSLCVSHETVEL